MNRQLLRSNIQRGSTPDPTVASLQDKKASPTLGQSSLCQFISLFGRVNNSSSQHCIVELKVSSCNINYSSSLPFLLPFLLPFHLSSSSQKGMKASQSTAWMYGCFFGERETGPDSTRQAAKVSVAWSSTELPDT
jgi:hypothetical protein